MLISKHKVYNKENCDNFANIIIEGISIFLNYVTNWFNFSSSGHLFKILSLITEKIFQKYFSKNWLSSHRKHYFV